jgi:hypothetical protein
LFAFHSFAQTSPVTLSGKNLLYTYAVKPLEFDVSSNIESLKIEDVTFSEGFVWHSGCKGSVLKLNKKCTLVIDYKPGEKLSDHINVDLKINGQNFVYQFGFSKIKSPVSFIAYEQKSLEQQNKTQFNLIYLPWTKIGSSGDPVDVWIETQHFKPLKLKKISAPNHIKLTGCDIQSFKSCTLKIVHRPQSEGDVDGTLALTFSDGKDDFDVELKLRARVWRPLMPKKALVTQDESYLLLSDGSFWKSGLDTPWKLEKSGVADFFTDLNHKITFTKSSEKQDYEKIIQDNDAFFGIDQKNDLWFKGATYVRGPDEILYPKESKNWEKIESQIEQYESCGHSTMRLKTDGKLLSDFATLEDVSSFGINCQRLSTTPSFSNIFALKKDGSLWGIGANGHGQLGFSTKKMVEEKKWHLISKDVATFSANEYLLMFMKKDRTLWASGSHSFDVSKQTRTPEAGSIVQLGEFR